MQDSAKHNHENTMKSKIVGKKEIYNIKKKGRGRKERKMTRRNVSSSQRTRGDSL